MAYVAPSAWYISSVAYAAISAWTASHSYMIGALTRQTSAVGAEKVFVCVVAGISGGTEPSWVTTKGAKTTDGTVTWQECTGQPGVNGDTAHQSVWTASSTPSLGLIIYDSGTSSLQICTTSGLGSSSAPAFSATAGSTRTDGSAVWTSLGLASSFGAFAAPHARAALAYTSTWGTAGSDFYFADNHAETQSTALTLNPPGTASLPSRHISVDHTASMPPTGVKSGASISTTGSVAITLSNASGQTNYFYGMTWSSAGSLILGGNGDLSVTMVLDACSLVLNNSTPASTITVAGSSTSLITYWNNTTVTFGNTNQTITVNSAQLIWRNTPNAVSGSVVNNLIDPLGSGGGTCDILIEAVDLSGMATNSFVTHASGSGYICIKDCKLPSGTVGAALSGSGNLLTCDVLRSDSSGTNYRVESHSGQGDLTTNTTIVRTAGASDGTTAVSHQVITGSGVLPWFPFFGVPIAIWNSVLGTNRGVTLYGVINAATVPNNDQVWFDVDYLGSSSSPLGSYVSGFKSSQLATGSALSADTSSWDSMATARANSMAYVVGDVVKTSSNPGRIFFCISGSGSTAASEPAGYASAVDGESVTDGSYTFRAGCRFSMTLTLSATQPAQAGYLYAYPRLGGASMTVYIDPLIVLS